ncbi:hypothetical protein DLAC_08389 [Tieghemostelium lacteum]|uniref:F-box domain-containing protein n=1 Tax=Tieghemostelium lacteum TaxID=361077 RepID=A0A151ZC19_TIELA|nr:hypothetical protein DLAC_08389 [Tieghemostelium lacteum]|eukprot:KYQ91424.1 hypothetical protein DLAC_08389 [Tieghemostelium lacteum]
MLPRFLFIEIIKIIKLNFKRSNFIWFEDLALVSKEWRDFIQPKFRGYTISNLSSFLKAPNKTGMKLEVSIEHDMVYEQWGSDIIDHLYSLRLTKVTQLPNLRSPPHLKMLFLSKCGLDFLNLLNFIETNIQSILNLKLLDIGVEGDIDILPLIPSFRNLKYLEICNNNFDIHTQLIGLESLSLLENLDKIKITNHQVTKKSFRSLLEKIKASKVDIENLIFTSIDTLKEDVNYIFSSTIFSKTIKEFEFSIEYIEFSVESFVHFLNHNHHLKSIHIVGSTSGNIENLYISNTTLEYLHLASYLVYGLGISLYCLWNCQSNLKLLNLDEVNTPIDQLMSLHPKCYYVYAFDGKYKCEQKLIDLINLNVRSVKLINYSTSSVLSTSSTIFECITTRNQHIQHINFNCQIECDMFCQLVKINLPTLTSLHCYKIINWNLNDIVDNLILNTNIRSITICKCYDNVPIGSNSEFIQQAIKLLNQNHTLTNIGLYSIRDGTFSKDDLEQFDKTLKTLNNLNHFSTYPKSIRYITNKYMMSSYL